jgi:subtilisin family serine protease
MKKILLSTISLACLVNTANAQSVYGKTSLMTAAEYNDIPAVHRIVSQGANVNAIDNNYNTAYCYAYKNKNYEVARILEANGAQTGRRCYVGGKVFIANSMKAPYYNNSETYNVERSRKSYIPRFQVPGTKPILYTLAGVGVAAAVGGGGGGGGGSEGGSVQMAGPPPANSNDVDPSSFETAEFNGDAGAVGLNESFDSEFLDVMNAQYAYARGYTGAGQKIAILDTGIDIDHAEFTGQLNADLTGTDLQSGDNNPDHDPLQNDHGTMVASVAGAAKDGTGIHGVAYDATIIPYRIGLGTGSINGALTDDAVNDAVAKGATVINMSYGTDADAANNATTISKDNLELGYTGQRDFNDNTNTAAMNTFINNVTTNEVVLVKAAGNEAYSQPGEKSALPLHYSEFNGHFVTVVALDATGTRLTNIANEGWGSNHCGVAKNYCLAAVGTAMVAAQDGGTYTYGGGTSAAAPSVAGAVAVVQDAFGLSADRTLNILFQTATDLGVAGVDDMYGHGLVNLDLATAPGAELMAPNGVNNVNFANSKVTSSGAIAQLNIPNFKIEDELYRTFEIKGNGLRTELDTNFELAERDKTYAKEVKKETKKVNDFMSTSYVKSNDESANALDTFESLNFTAKIKSTDYSFGFTHNPGLSDDEIVMSSSFLDQDSTAHPYLSLADEGFVAKTKYKISDSLNFETNVFFGDVEDDGNNLGRAASALTKLAYVKDKTNIGIEFGFINEYDTLLGAKFEGALAIGTSNYTYFTGLNAKTDLTANLNLFANAYLGVTKANTATNSLITGMSDIVSHSASAGLEYNFADDKQAGFVISQPLKVSSGDVNFDVLTSGNIDKGYNYSNFSQSLSPSATQLDLQAFYKQQMSENTKLQLGALHKLNAGSVKGETDTSVLVKLRHKF